MLFPELQVNMLRFSSRSLAYGDIVLAVAARPPQSLIGMRIALTRLQRERIFLEMGIPADRTTLIGFPLEVI